jgi:hypothetical protein
MRFMEEVMPARWWLYLGDKLLLRGHAPLHTPLQVVTLPESHADAGGCCVLHGASVL